MNNKFYIERKSFPLRFATVLMILAIPFLIGGRWETIRNILDETAVAITAAFLPIVGCLLLILVIRFFGKRLFLISVLPVCCCIFPIMLGSLSRGFSGVVIGEVAICFVEIIVYACTMFGGIKHKVFAALIFALHLVYRGYFWIYKSIKAGTAAITLFSTLNEIAIIFMLLAFFMVCVGIRKETTIDPSLGKNIAPPIPGENILSGNTVAVPSEKKAEEAETPKEFSVDNDVKPEIEINNKLHDMKEEAEEIGTFDDGLQS